MVEDGEASGRELSRPWAPRAAGPRLGADPEHLPRIGPTWAGLGEQWGRME